MLISCDERPAKRVRGSSVVRAETPAPAEVGYALSSGRHADLIDRSGVQSNLLSILTQNMAKHSLKRRISPRFLEDRRRASVGSVPARKIGKINFELRQWRQPRAGTGLVKPLCACPFIKPLSTRQSARRQVFGSITHRIIHRIQ